MVQSREVRLSSRPVGMPTEKNFQLVQVTLPDPAQGEVQVRNTWMTVDPYMRGRMSDAKSYAAPFQLDQPLQGAAIGTVIASNDPKFLPGDIVKSLNGWREYYNAPANDLKKLDLRGLPAEAFLGVAGMPGLTAYVGMMRIASLKPGDVVFVSGAAGAVGMMVCQIAKLKGHKVIGTAGGAEKIAFLKDELGVDVAIDYKATRDLTVALADAAPEGIDVYFDNVGGDHLQAALQSANPLARFAMCGMISMYNSAAPVPGPTNLSQIVVKSLHVEGFIVTNNLDMEAAYHEELVQWREAGRLRWRQTVRDGLENAVGAFLGLFSGENVGKMLVKLY